MDNRRHPFQNFTRAKDKVILSDHGIMVGLAKWCIPSLRGSVGACLLYDFRLTRLLVCVSIENFGVLSILP